MEIPSYIKILFGDYNAQEREAREALLSEEERLRWMEFNSEKRKKEFVTGRYVLRTLVAQHLGVEARNVVFVRDPQGALDLPDRPDLRLSLAHEALTAVAVISDHQVGVDIERIQARHPELHRYLLHPAEEEPFHALPLSLPHRHILYWTIKESVLKGMRTGLRHSPKSLCSKIDLDKSRATVTTIEGAVWNVAFEQHNGSYLAVAWFEDQE